VLVFKARDFLDYEPTMDRTQAPAEGTANQPPEPQSDLLDYNGQ